MSEIHYGEDLWQWSRMEIRLNTFRWSTIPQKQFIIIIVVVIKAETIDSTDSALDEIVSSFLHELLPV